MRATTDNLLTASTLPDSVLQVLRSQDDSPDDLWRRRFQALIEQLPVMLYTAAPDNLGQIEYTSSQFKRWLGFPEKEWLGTPDFFISRVHPDDLDLVLENDATAIARGERFTIEYRLQAWDGSWHWVRDSAVLLRDSDGAPIAWQGVTIDITDIKAAEARQIEARRLYRSLIEQVPAVVFRESVDEPPVPLYVSPQIEDLLGYTPEEWCVDPLIWSRVLHPQDRDRVHQRTAIQESHETSSHEEFRMLTKDGRTIWIREDRALVVDEHGNPTCWQGLLIDITRQKQLEDQLVYQARHDSLTGLPNRSYFSEIVTAALDRGAPTGQRVALLFLDLDGFKALNDSLGHHCGDEALIAIGTRLRGVLRSGDVVARLGGDEFAILAEGPFTCDDVVQIADRILGTLRQSLLVCGNDARCSGSVGIACGVAGVDSHFDLLRWADQAMYRAKASGKNRYAFFDAAADAGSTS